MLIRQSLNLTAHVLGGVVVGVLAVTAAYGCLRRLRASREERRAEPPPAPPPSAEEAPPIS